MATRQKHGDTITQRQLDRIFKAILIRLETYAIAMTWKKFIKDKTFN
jgi:hypothetical protein